MGTVTETPLVPAALSDVHRDYLRAFAISDEIISSAGIWSDGDLIMFPYRDGDLLVNQRRRWPEDEETAALGKKSQAKYLWAAETKLHFNALRPVNDGDGPVLICEGTKQALCVASWAPPEYAIYGMAGCSGWVDVNLARFKGRRVIIMLDADAGSNHRVYTAGEKLAAKLKALGAEPSFVPSPAWGTDGIDDFMTGIEPELRTEVLVNLISESRIADKKGTDRPRDKPADRKPAFRADPQAPDTGGRPIVVVNDDRREVIRRILFHLKQLWDGSLLFNYGGVLALLHLESDEAGQVTSAATEPLARGAFAYWLSEGIYTCKHIPATAAAPDKWEPAWPELITLEAVLAAGNQFAPLDRISRTPFIRADGTACAKQGYDETSSAYLVTGNSGMDRLDIPDTPAREQAVQAAGRLLGPDWLGDMPWRDEASRANALALVLTPFIRGLVPLVPLAVISGLQPGVGKGLLGDCVSLMLTGENISPLPWSVIDDDENRKQVLSAFREGASTLMWFDEAHQIESHALSRAITSITYADRILGVSNIARYPNRATWLATGNQVQVSTDMARRAYFIELYPQVPDPQDRPPTDFEHGDLREWTVENRPELVTAALTIIRSWYAAGCPDPEHARTTAMGSFEKWDRMMSGILDWAGVPGFLGNLTTRRAERDAAGGYWSEHARWLAEVFGTAEFTALDVKRAAAAAATDGKSEIGNTTGKPDWFGRASASIWEAPPKLNRYDDASFTRDLGQAYARNQDRWYEGLRIIKAGTGHGTKVLWKIETQPVQTPRSSDTVTDQGGMDRMDQNLRTGQEVSSKSGTSVLDGRDGSDGSPNPTRRVRAGADASAHAPALTRGAEITDPSRPSGPSLGFDLETADAHDLFRRAPDPGYIRLAGLTGPGGSAIVKPASLPALLGVGATAELESGTGNGTGTRTRTWFGHNICGFDGLAMARHLSEHPHAFWDRFCDGARDTELIARQYWPPRSRESGTSADKLGLDAVAALCGVPGKTDHLPRLAKIHGGYDKIPLDDPEYRSYLLDGDLPATAAVAAFLLPFYDTDPYLPREHQLARIAGHMRLNGLLVDQPLLRERYEAGETRKRAALQFLHDGWGLPLGRMVLRGRAPNKREEFQAFDSPLSTNEGRAWLETQWQRYQVPDPPRTDTGKLALGAAELTAITRDPACPPDLAQMITLMNIVTTTRTVYQTATEWLCPDGRVHPSISFRQASGRWSVTEPGLTVFGKHAGRHVERDIFVAPPGKVLMSFDLAQVDMRAIAWLSGDPAYRAMFEPGRDPHAEIAGQLGIARQDAKAVAHGWNYGRGRDAMIRAGLDPGKVHAFCDGMEARFPHLIGWRTGIQERAAAGEVLDNGFGRRMRAEPHRAYTVGPALMGQGGARDILGHCMLRLDPALYPALLLQVHDELVFEFDENGWEEPAAAVREAMTFELASAAGPVPILVDQSGPGHSFGEISAK